MSTITERLETTLRELKYPPLQGGPTKDDIIDVLEAALNCIEDPEDPEKYEDPEDPEKYEELQDEINDLYDGINRAISDLEDLEDISEIDGIIEDLRRL